MQNVSDSTFENDVIKSDKPVLIDFWAEWCGPCKALTPVLEEVAASANFQEKITFTKMNVDENPETPAKFGVRGIPTLLIMKNGEAVATRVGSATKAQIEAFIETNI